MNQNKRSAATMGVDAARKANNDGSFGTSSLPSDHAARVAFFKAHDVHPERGEYWGDGVARTLDGTPFEPLSWGHTLTFGGKAA